jgi:putative transferase (TIGR04331 family)
MSNRRSVYVAPSSYSEIWAKAEKTAFLGRWCFECENNPPSLNFPHWIGPCVWELTGEREKAAEYLESVSDRVLDQLGDHLNGYHKVKFSKRQWRILLGCWLFHAVHNLYEQFIHAEQVEREFGTDIWTRQLPAHDEYVPRVAIQIVQTQVSPFHKALLFGQMAEAMGWHVEKVDGPASKVHGLELSRSVFSFRSRILTWAYSSINLLNRWRSAGIGRTMFVRFGAYTGQQLRLLMAIKSSACLVNIGGVPKKQEHVDFALRKDCFRSLSSGDRFAKVLAACLPYMLPTAFLEDFKSWRDSARKLPVDCIDKVVTSIGFAYEEAFGFWAVRLCESEVPLVGVQHGGGYGLFDYCPEEIHETRCADHYVTWGWKSAVNHKELPSLRIANSPSYHPVKGRIPRCVVIGSARPRHAHRIQSGPLGGQMGSYFKMQMDLFAGLEPEVFERCALRPYPRLYGSKDGAWYREVSKTPRLEPRSMSKVMKEYDLFVYDHNGTGFLETLAGGYPTMIMWDPKVWPVRKEAEKDLHELKRVGIFHPNAESAVQHLSRVICDPGAWWDETEVISVRERFVSRYAQGRGNDWLTKWKQWLKTL